MAYETWGTGGLTVEGQLTTFEKRLLSRFRATTVYNKDTLRTKRGIPQNGGKSISFRRMESIYSAGNAGSAAAGSAPSALTEGTPGAAIQATWTQILATVSQYGQYSYITDVAELQSIDKIIPEYTDNFAEAMKDGMDLLTRDVLVAGTNVLYAGTAASRGAVGSGRYLTLTELRRGKRALKQNNAKPIAGEGGKFVVIGHPNNSFDLEGDSNITNIWQYAGARGVDTNALFDVTYKDLPFGVRFYETTNVRVFASLGLSGADVYGVMMFGEEAFGTVDYDSMPAKMYYKPRGSAGTNDPLDQVASVGYKFSHVAVILNQANLVRLEVAASTKDAA